MDVERWKRVKDLCLTALEHHEHERRHFLDEACKADTELRREVESLLANEKQAADFLESLPAEFAANVLVESRVSGGALGVIDPNVMLGKVISHFRILETLGEGGMGIVFKAEDIKLGRLVALKFLLTNFLVGPLTVEQLRREARAAAALNHPNICTIHEIADYDGQPFIVMELLVGNTLKHLIEDGPLPIAQILNIGTQIADALDAAHSAGITHRDIKPANIFITHSGQAKVLDFGLAKLTAAPHAGAETVDVKVRESTLLNKEFNSSGRAMGTIAYMSPEQACGEHLDTRTDLFCLGLVLYEMATGQRPFSGDTDTSIRHAVLKLPALSPGKLNPNISPELERIIGKCLEKDPSARYQSAADLKGQIAALVHQSTRTIPTRIRQAVWIAAGVLLIALVSAPFYYLSRQSKRLTDKDNIVLADFANSTGDPIFDDALKQALAVELGQSPFLNLLSDRKVAETMRMMKRSGKDRITADVGREVCLRTESKALLSGSISPLGSHYLIGLNAVACSTGDTLAREQGEAINKEDVLRALSRASSNLRTKLGESLPSVQKFDVPVEVTTPSLEALKAYSLGIKVWDEEGEAPSVPFFRQAIELDPNFPMAYSTLGAVYYGLSQQSLALEYATKAYRLRDRVSEREKLYISQFYFAVTGDLDNLVQTTQLWKLSYPRDCVPHGYLGTAYSSMGQHDKALAEFQETLRLQDQPGENDYSSLGEVYFNLNQLSEARAIFDQALAHNVDGGFLRSNMYYLAFLQGDFTRMDQELAWAVGKPGNEDLLLSIQSDTEAYYGRLAKARDFSRRAVDSALRSESKETAALWEVNTALREAESGNGAFAKRKVSVALTLSSALNLRVAAALALARVGEASRARVLIKEVEKNNPFNSMLKLYWLPTINAAIELQNGDSRRALLDLETAAPYELGTAGTFINALYPAYVRGQAYLLARNGPAAVVEFQKILNHKGIVVNFLTGALANLQIGRAYAMSGDLSRAQAAYRDFFTLWKDADPDIPVFRQAQAEYRELLSKLKRHGPVSLSANNPTHNLRSAVTRIS